MYYKITWDTAQLRENGFNYNELVDYCEEYDIEVIEQHGGSLIVLSDKSDEGIYQELKRKFGIEIKIIEIDYQ